MDFKRKRIRLAAENYFGQRTYFITICCPQRKRLLQNERLAEWVIAKLKQEGETRGFAIHAYCVMPDHLHFLAEGESKGSNLLALVRAFKQKTSIAYRRKRGQDLWQYNFYDHILRGKDNSDGVAWYIWMNPVRKGICENPRAYSLSGSFTMDWKAKPKPLAMWVPWWKQRQRNSETTRLSR